jgi:hypothetical protein
MFFVRTFQASKYFNLQRLGLAQRQQGSHVPKNTKNVTSSLALGRHANLLLDSLPLIVQSIETPEGIDPIAQGHCQNIEVVFITLQPQLLWMLQGKVYLVEGLSAHNSNLATPAAFSTCVPAP